MQIHEDRQVQHATGDGLQRSTGNTCAFRKTAHPRVSGGYQGWAETTKADTLNVFDITEMRTPVLIVSASTTTDTLSTPSAKLRDRLEHQVENLGGAARTSLSAIGFDSYNLLVTDGLAITLQASRADDHHLPVVFIRREDER